MNWLNATVFHNWLRFKKEIELRIEVGLIFKPKGDNVTKLRSKKITLLLKITLMSLTLGFTIMPSSQSSAAPSNLLMADTANPYGGTKIDPLPASAPIFTVSNGGKNINYSKNDLLAIKSTVISIFEPFVKKKQSFTVIPLDYFLAKSSIKSSMIIETIALNEYKFLNKAGNFSNAKAYLAIQRFGKDIPYDQGGPVRLIYSNSSSWAKNLDAWNWSLRTLKTHTN